MSYAMVINFTDTDGTNRSIVLDAVDDTKVNATSNIASHPMVNGDIVADHTIKQPISVGFNGKFSSKTAKTIVTSSNGAILSDVEKLFERIKDESILCTLIKVKVEEKTQGNSYEDVARFAVRENMILNSINWTEGINTLSYSLDWTQIMMVDVETFDVDIDDAFLPYVTEPQSKNFSDVLFDQEQFDAQVLEFMMSQKIITANFLDFLKSWGVGGLVGIGIGAALAGTLVLALSVPVVGAAIVGAILAAGIIVFAFVQCFRRIAQRQKYKIEPFDVGRNQKQTEAELKRFSEFFDHLHSEVAKMNNHLKVYSISENTQQECLLTIGSSYYVFSLVKNNTTQKWGCIISDMNDSIKGQSPDITSSLRSIGDCNLENKIMKTDDGYYVYLIRPNEDSDENDLTSYYILTSSIDLSKYNEILTSIIEDAILR